MTTPPSPRKRRDRRGAAALAVTAGIILCGYLLSLLPGRAVRGNIDAPFARLEQHRQGSSPARAEESPATQDKHDHLPPPARHALKTAEGQIEAKHFNEAIATLNRQRPALKNEPQALLLLARALEGNRDHAAARDFYTAALDRDPLLAGAYWGVATTSEALGDLTAAVGAMRSYLHVEPDKDPDRLQIAQARSALWEWEARLGRGPWGPTKGIPPGFTADDIKRDGRGVAVRMQVPGTEQPDGSLLAEIRHADKQVIFPRP
ncbi:tetratricopeptide repeat protein [Aromatoleum evansii]|uniref:tetratricopeptide repeat protein n=1 Tax=Aromatoleum evansii TaxID=59406 RepID=UPI00145CB55E|nr:tetratricopeptide repeat protein [Aromatoleum evansii]NMG31975.1 hypothetical protein [Aromatoleum evansii]